jgi:hypothetical protein
MTEWQDNVIVRPETGEQYPVVERYLLPGKNTGFVVVSSERKCFTELRGRVWPLGLLPDDMSPEDRRSVVNWAMFEMHYRTRLAFRKAVSGEPMPDAFEGGE